MKYGYSVHVPQCMVEWRSEDNFQSQVTPSTMGWKIKLRKYVRPFTQ